MCQSSVVPRSLFGRAWSVLMVCSILLISVGAPARDVVAEPEAGWQLVREGDGITSWKSESNGEPLPSYRARTTIDATVWEALSVLDDVERACEWTSHCAEMRRVRTVSEREVLVYARMAAPWPVRDRDVAVRVTVVDGVPGELIVRILAQSEVPVSPHPRAVRMPHFAAHYRFRAQSAARTEVEYQLSFDPGGALPDWLKVLVAKNLAHDTLGDLRSRVRWARLHGMYVGRAQGLEQMARALPR